MVSLRCPRCANTIDAQPGAWAQCPRCGFASVVPAQFTPPGPAAPPAPAAGPAPAPVYYAGPPGAPTPVLGKPRRFIVAFLLGIVTLGVYYFVYDYLVFRDVDRQHGQPHAKGWYWTGLLLRIGAAVVAIVAIVAAALAAAASAEPEDSPPELELGASIFVYYGLALLGTAVYFAYLFKEVGKVERVRQQRGMREGLSAVWFLLLLILGLALIVPTIFAYYFVNKSVNEVWASVYAERGVPWPL